MSSLTFAQDWGVGPPSDQAPQTVTITFHGDGIIAAYPPGTSAPGWLGFQLPDIVDPAGTELRVTATDLGLSPGVYQTTVRIAVGKPDASAAIYKDITIELMVRDHLTVTVDDATIGGRVGESQFSNVSNLQVAKYGAWTVQVDQPWLQLSTTAGTDQQRVTATAMANSLPAGHHTATVTVTSSDSQQTEHVDIDLAIDAPRWWPERRAVALTQAGDRVRLSDTVQLEAAGDLASMGFAAHSDTAWLTASIAGAALTLTADPSQVSDGLQLASVSVTANAAPELPAQTLRVALYKRTAAVTALSTIPVLTSSGTAPIAIAVDPLRPVVYVGADQGGAIEGYDVYTGALVLTVAPPVAGQALWQVTADGRSLVTRSYDVTKQAWGNTLVAYDLDAGTWGAPSTARTAESAPAWNVGGVELSYDHGFSDADGNRYGELGEIGPPGGGGLPSSQVFADPQGTHVLVMQSIPLSSGQVLVDLDRLHVAVFQLARKIMVLDAGSDLAEYDLKGPLSGPIVPPPAPRAARRSLDAYPQFSRGGTWMWAPRLTDAGLLTWDDTGEYLGIEEIVPPDGTTFSIQALSAARDGQAAAIWPVGQRGVVAHYPSSQDGLPSLASLPVNAPAIAGGAALGSMLKHSADDLRVIGVLDPTLASPAGNTLVLMNQ